MLTLRTARRWLLLAFISTGASGCGSKPPSLEIMDVRVKETTADAVALDIRLSAYNPNEDPIELREMKYVVHVDKARPYRGRRSGEATLRPWNRTELIVPAVVRYDDISRGLTGAPITCRISGSVAYLPPGRLARTLYNARLYRPRSDISGSIEASLGAR